MLTTMASRRGSTMCHSLSRNTSRPGLLVLDQQRERAGIRMLPDTEVAVGAGRRCQRHRVIIQSKEAGVPPAEAAAQVSRRHAEVRGDRRQEPIRQALRVTIVRMNRISE